MNKLGVYIHIPFCVKKCNYCDFPSFGQSTSVQRQAYTKQLMQEIQSQRELLQSHTIDTIFIGGGTPSLMEVECMEQILHTIYAHTDVSKDVEITMECNPGTVKKDAFMAYGQMGINRISFGVQSANEKELRVLGRVHTFDDFLRSFHYAREAGIANINVDMMSGIPEQTIESYRHSCEQVIRCKPEHISAYSLIIEEGTPFAKQYREQPPVSEELDREMYHFTKEFFQKKGYERYEISNYAKPDWECKHNLKYWNLEDYVGFGLSAASCVDGVRSQNACTFEGYYAGERETHIVSTREQMEEYMFLGLRKCQGVSKKQFENKFHKELDDIYCGICDKLQKEGLIEQDAERVVLTDWGMDVSNQVMALFLLDE